MAVLKYRGSGGTIQTLLDVTGTLARIGALETKTNNLQTTVNTLNASSGWKRLSKNCWYKKVGLWCTVQCDYVSGLEAKTASFERATSGIWKYEKRSDGTCVCEGQQTRTVNIENIYSGNIYYGDFAAVSFPSGLFTAVPDVRATIQSAPVTVWVATASNSKPSTSSTQTVRLLSGGPETSISVTVSYRAVGRWK